LKIDELGGIALGYFSICCAKTHLPVLCADSFWGRFAPRLCRVVMLSPEGDRITRDYDGYGCGDVLDFDACKMVLADAYQSESYGQLGESHYEPGQGVFHSRGMIAVLRETPSLPSHLAYTRLYKDYCSEESRIKLQLLNERGVRCESELALEVGRALEHLADGFDAEYERMLKQRPDIRKWVPEGYDNAQRLARLYDDTLVARTTAYARKLVEALKA
jgi:hypothetical protein